MIPQIRRILYATDLTKNSAYAFFYAVDMATEHQASIIILHTIEPVRHYLDEEAGAQAEGAPRKAKKQAQETDTEEIKRRLQQFCKRTEAQFGTLWLTGYPKSLFHWVSQSKKS